MWNWKLTMNRFRKTETSEAQACGFPADGNWTLAQEICLTSEKSVGHDGKSGIKSVRR